MAILAYAQVTLYTCPLGEFNKIICKLFWAPHYKYVIDTYDALLFSWVLHLKKRFVKLPVKTKMVLFYL